MAFELNCLNLTAYNEFKRIKVVLQKRNLGYIQDVEIF